MSYFAEVSKSNIDEYLSKYSLIACGLRNSRIKAKQTAVLEMLFSQFDNEVLFIPNGPLGDIKGLFSFFCPKKNLAAFKEKLFGTGYCDKFYILDFEDDSFKNHTELKSINPLVWKGRDFSIDYFFIQDSKIYEEHSPHNREFKIEDSSGNVKTVFGYRGDGSELGRRSLPVEDARCMVNLSMPCKNKRAIDPFAGAGGIVYEYKYIAENYSITSIDIDPVLKPGLEFYGSSHYVMNAKDASFPKDSFDSIITEVPFSHNALDGIIMAVNKITECLTKDGLLVMMCKISQAENIYKALLKQGLLHLFNREIDRKGTGVEISVWCMSKKFLSGMEDFLTVLKKTR